MSSNSARSVDSLVSAPLSASHYATTIRPFPSSRSPCSFNKIPLKPCTLHTNRNKSQYSHPQQRKAKNRLITPTNTNPDLRVPVLAVAHMCKRARGPPTQECKTDAPQREERAVEGEVEQRVQPVERMQEDGEEEGEGC
jgi:hypothetical protein